MYIELKRKKLNLNGSQLPTDEVIHTDIRLSKEPENILSVTRGRRDDKTKNCEIYGTGGNHEWI